MLAIRVQEECHQREGKQGIEQAEEKTEQNDE